MRSSSTKSERDLDENRFAIHFLNFLEGRFAKENGFFRSVNQFARIGLLRDPDGLQSRVKKKGTRQNKGLTSSAEQFHEASETPEAPGQSSSTRRPRKSLWLPKDFSRKSALD